MKRTVRPSKSYRGCQRCKARKVKCDETRPACQGCLRAGVECSGFPPQYRWSRKHEKFGRPAHHQGSLEADENGRIDQTAGQDPEEAEQTSMSVPRDVRPAPGGPLSRAMTPWGSQAPMGLHFSDWVNLEMGHYDDVSFSDMTMLDQSLAMSVPVPSMEIPGQNGFLMGLEPNPMHQSTEETHENTHEVPESTGHANGTSDSQTSHAANALADQVTSPARANRSSGADSLLGTFYRLSTPTPIAQFTDEHLVKHYFTEVCSLYSCFDSHLNPFRSLVTSLWTSSTTVCLSIQSMAIAHLANHYLYMASLGQVKRSQSWKSLQLDLQLHRAGKMPLEKVLISLLLLGLSSAWHQPSNLGLQYLSIARNLMQAYLQSNQSSQPYMTLTNEKFFLDALMYWEMLASFVEPVPMMPFPGYGAPSPHLPTESEQNLPHPWTGVTTELHYALAEIGRILRRQRRSHSAMPRRVDSGDKTWCDDDEQWAASLERFLHSIQIPGPDAILDYADEDTPRSDLVRGADAYRYIGLLEIYRAFPRLLEDKIRKEEKFPPSYGRELEVTTDHSSYLNVLDSWLCAIAIHTLEILKDVSLSSAACRLQPLVLISCATQLQLPDRLDTPLDELRNVRQNGVVETRYFVEARMLALSRKYPQRQLLQMLDIVKEVWQRLDDRNEDAHWLDVAHEKGWQTMMG